MIDAISDYRRIEADKLHRGMKAGNAGRVFKQINWRRTTITGENILKLGHYVDVSPRPLAATSKIFQLLGTDHVAGIADNFDYLKTSEDKDIDNWLATVNDDLFALVQNSCPPLFLLRHPLLTVGHIFDGNHRSIVAAMLAMKGKKIELPVYEGTLRADKYLALNMYYFLLGLKNNPELTVSLAGRRLRS